MGRAVPYRRKRRRAPTRRSGLGPLLFGARPFALLAVLLAAWPTLDPALIEPLGPLASDPQRVTASFTRCGRGRGEACVIDGDTFKLGRRKIRVIGIDAPEVKGACAAERELAEKATARLQSLLNQGPFVMTGRIDDMQDRYGRDLRALSRERPDGTRQSIAEEMRASDLAHRYLGAKTSWC
jgi:endonuclease YncB( thermonuclease family)